MHSKKWIIIGREELTWFAGEEADDGVMADRSMLPPLLCSFSDFLVRWRRSQWLCDGWPMLPPLLCSFSGFLSVFVLLFLSLCLLLLPTFFSWVLSLFLVQLLLKMELWSCYWRRSRGRAAGLQRSHLLFLSSVRSSPCFFPSVFSGFPPWVLWGFVCSFLPRSLWPFSGFYKARECHAIASR